MKQRGSNQAARKKTRRRASETRYQQLFENLPLGIYQSTTDGKLLTVNPTLVRMLGYESEAELLAVDLARGVYLNPEDRKAGIHKLKQHGVLRDAEIVLRRKDGHLLTLLNNAHVVRDPQGKVMCYEGTLTDITERKRTETELAESEEKYRAIVENASDMIAIVQKGILKYANRAVCERLGWSSEEMTSPSFNFLEKIVAPKYRSLIARNMARRLKGEVIPPYEIHGLKRDGAEFSVVIRAERIVFRGKPADAVTATDISDRKLIEAAARRRAQELDSLQKTLLEITSRRDLTQLLNGIVESAATLLNATGGGLYLCDPSRRELRCVVSYNTKVNAIGVVLKYGEGSAGMIAQTGKPLIIDDYRTWPGRAAAYEKEQPFTAVLGAPMIWQGKVTGVIDVLHDTKVKQFTQDDLELLSLFANHAAIAVENLQAQEQLQRRAEELAALQATVLDVTSTISDVPKLLESIVERAVRLLRAQGGGLDLCDSEKREVRCVVSYKTARDFRGLVLKYGEGSSGLVAETGKPLVIDDYDKWSSAVRVPGSGEIGAEITVPMIWRGQVTGVIQVIAKPSTRRFTQSDLDLLALFANHAALAVENARLIDRVERHAVELESIVEERTGKLAESEARYRRLFESSPISLWEEDFSTVKKFFDELRGRGIKDVRGHLVQHPEDVAKCASMVKVVNVNGATLVLYGAETVEELLGELGPVLTRESQAETRFREELVALSEGRTRFESEFDNQTIRGGVKHVSLILNVVPGYEKTLAKVLVSIVDLTERKEMEQKLGQSEERFRGIAERSVDEIFEVDSEGRLTYASPSVERILGYMPEEVVGSPFHKYVPASELPKAVSALTSLMSGKKIEAVQFNALRKDGSQVTVEVACSPILRDGKVVGAQGIIRDITERIKMEAKLAESERLAAVGETAAMVGHDLRNPLQAISTAAYVLEKNLSSAASERTKEMLEAIKNSIHDSDRIVSDLLEYSQELRLEFSETTPKLLASAAISQLKIPMNITVLDLTSDDPKIRVDAARIKRVFVNLVENAVDAMPNGGELRISSDMSNGSVEVKFTDTGQGIDEDLLRQLYKPLVTTKPKGIGLGLAICKHIAEAHGGSIFVESGVGQGTTFTVTIPIAPRQTGAKGR